MTSTDDAIARAKVVRTVGTMGVICPQMSPTQRRNDHSRTENEYQQDGCTCHRIPTREESDGATFGVSGHERDEVAGSIREGRSAHQTDDQTTNVVGQAADVALCRAPRSAAERIVGGARYRDDRIESAVTRG